MPKIAPCLWFDDQGEEAATFYTSIFPNSRITEVTRYGKAGPGKEGSVKTVSFSLDGEDYVALHVLGGHLAAGPLPVPGRGRRLLGQARRRRGGRPVRLAEGPVRTVLADCPDRAARADHRPGP